MYSGPTHLYALHSHTLLAESIKGIKDKGQMVEARVYIEFRSCSLNDASSSGSVPSGWSDHLD